MTIYDIYFDNLTTRLPYESTLIIQSIYKSEPEVLETLKAITKRNFAFIDCYFFYQLQQSCQIVLQARVQDIQYLALIQLRFFPK